MATEKVMQPEEQNLKIMSNEELISPTGTGKDENIKQLLYKLERTALFVNRLDYFGNAIPIGAFCCGITFIIFGFTRANVYAEENKSRDFLSGLILIFGGFGQITAGMLEYIKVRSYTALLYLTLGFFCFSHWFVEYNDFPNTLKIAEGDHEEKAFYFGAWFIIMLPLVLASLKINIFFLVQTGCTCIFFLLRWIGEVSEKKGLTEYASGIFQIIAGFVSFYIFCYQIIDEEWKKELLPTLVLNKGNEIDFNIVNAQIISQTPTPQ
jgi:succinate-acetate transporter protein